MIYDRYIKRITDIFLSCIGLIIFAPLFLLVGIAIKIDSRGPVIFKQCRVGKHGRVFNICKFRTMLTFEDSYFEDGSQMPNNERITKVGKILRNTSIDEIPQLINILAGDMSIVGPRPALEYQAAKYNVIQAQRLCVRPGLTGLAQICGRNGLTWEEKINYDLKYIQSISLLHDVKIIFKTFYVIFKSDQVEFTRHDDISAHGDDILKDVGYMKDEHHSYWIRRQ